MPTDEMGGLFIMPIVIIPRHILAASPEIPFKIVPVTIQRRARKRFYTLLAIVAAAHLQVHPFKFRLVPMRIATLVIEWLSE